MAETPKGPQTPNQVIPPPNLAPHYTPHKPGAPLDPALYPQRGTQPRVPENPRRGQPPPELGPSKLPLDESRPMPSIDPMPGVRRGRGDAA
jgi:hypothetical protein